MREGFNANTLANHFHRLYAAVGIIQKFQHV
jgi:hypothetical protein